MQRVITRQIGNLRGFSTDSIFVRPSNVADQAINLQVAPDGTLQLRRGYQCQAAKIGGMGIGTFDDPTVDNIITVTINTDGYLYKKLTKQVYLVYDGQITGAITNITNPSDDLTQIHSVAHGLQTGAQVIIRNVGGATQINNPATFLSVTYNFYTITVVDADNFIVNGVPFSALSAYTMGGTWSIAFADSRYLTLSIFVDPRFINSFTSQSITCDIIENQSAQIVGNQNNVNTINVQFGQTLIVGNIVQFNDINGVLVQRNVINQTPFTITIDGPVVSVVDGTYINQFLEFPFGKGFDVSAPYLISTWIAALTTPVTGVSGLQVAFNGDTNYPAAFFQILEPTIIPSNTIYTLDYWYWLKVNTSTIPAPPAPGVPIVPFPGSANIVYQNSDDFENASMAAFDDVIYIANGWDYPQKYDGQTVYRTGMPLAPRVNNQDDTAYPSQPFSTGNVYEYAISYEQVDALGHIIEGEISEINQWTVGHTPCAIDVIIKNLISKQGENWNTNFALAVGGFTTPNPSYGPDINGFYYALAAVNLGYTLKIGDSAYYVDLNAGFMSSFPSDTFIIPVVPGHAILPGDIIYFFDSAQVERQRTVVSIDTVNNTITIDGTRVNLLAAYPHIWTYKVSIVFGNVAIVDGNQTNVNNIQVLTNHTIQLSDIVEFIDSNNDLQRRNVTFVDGTHVTVDQLPVSVNDKILIASTNQRADAINLQRLNPNPALLSTGASGQLSNAISNNLRIKIYRTKQGESFGTNGELFLIASIPNDGSGAATQLFIDAIPDVELSIPLDQNLENPPNPPPISKYVCAFGSQMFYAGGERGNPENSDKVFFSGTSGTTAVPNPEAVSLATDSFDVPNVDDDITGIGVAGSTLITTKNQSIWAATGNFLSGQIDVVQIAKGTNIGCVAHATIACVGSLMYFAHTNGVYAITENQLFPTDAFGNPIPISIPIAQIFRETNYLPWTKLVLKRAVAVNYTKELQYILFIPCEDSQATIRTANANSIILMYDYQNKNWFKWINMNAAGGMFIIDDDLYFQERRYSGVDGNTANLYKQHRFYRLVDHADHAGYEYAEWRSSWEDLGQPEVRKKFCRCILLMDRVSALLQYNNPIMIFSSYLNRLPDLQNTISVISQTDNTRNSAWGSAWGWNYWSGYQDSFVTVNLKQGTVAKSIQVGFTMQGINMDIRLAGFQLETIPENRKTVAR